MLAGGTLLLLACGGTTVIEDGEASSGTSSSSGTTTSVGSTGSGMQPCSLSVPCPVDQYCATFPGSCDSAGVCMPKPQGCDADCPGVCGCDGETYCNACGAQQAGVDVGPDKKGCFPKEDVEYSAESVLGGLDRILVRKFDLADDLCVVAVFVSPMMSLPGFVVSMPAPWALENAFASPGVGSCKNGGAMMAVSASGASGSLQWKEEPGMLFPCEIDMALTVSFSDVFPGLGSQELFNGPIAVEGCF